MYKIRMKRGVGGVHRVEGRKRQRERKKNDGAQTLSESFRVLRDDPVAGIDIDHLEPREKLADDGDHLVGDVLALGSADEQSRFLEADRGRILEGEVAHVV